MDSAGVEIGEVLRIISISKWINSWPSQTRSRSDSHVADTKFDSDDKSSLLIKCQRAHTVSR